MPEFTTKQPVCYEVKHRNGKQYALFRVQDIEQAIAFASEFQCYVGRFYSLTVKPYRGKHWYPDKFAWLVEG